MTELRRNDAAVSILLILSSIDRAERLTPPNTSSKLHGNADVTLQYIDMRNLLLLRHAKSSWKQPELSDHDRPLNKRGKRAAPLMASYLQHHVPKPTEIWCSTSVRTRATLDLFLESGWLQGTPIHYTRDIYEAQVEDLLMFLHQRELADDECLMLIGHNPGMTALINLLAEEMQPVDNLPTAGAAWIRCPNWPPQPRGNTLQAITTPKQLAPR